MSARGVLDTGPLVAFLDERDKHHAWTVEALTGFESPLETCEAVVAEAWFLLGRARHGRVSLHGLLRSGHVRVSYSFAPNAGRVLALMQKYADQPMSLADACLVHMAELDARAAVITLDRDFSVYRRGRSALRVVAPFPGGHK